MLKETTGAFDGTRTHDLHITSQTYNPCRHFKAGLHSLMKESNCVFTCNTHCQESVAVLEGE